VIKQHIRSLICEVGQDAVTNYVTAWHDALRQLDSTPWDFTAFDCVQTFVDDLPMSDTYQSLWEWINDSFSSMPLIFPDFEDIVTTIINVDVQHCRLLMLRPSLATVTGRAPTLSVSMTIPANLSTPSTALLFHPQTLRPVCTNCKALGHMIKTCWKPSGGKIGGREKFLTDNPQLAHSCANLASDTHAIPPDLPSLLQCSSPQDTSILPTDTTPDAADAHVASDSIESSLLYLCARSSSKPNSSSSISGFFADNRLVCPGVFLGFNTILDLGCTTHIIHDRWFFWTYNPALATPVGMANCGVLNTLAWAEVHFCAMVGSVEYMFCMKDCLHAPDCPVNLLSVGAMAEKHIHVVFNFGIMTIYFPRASPASDNILLSASVSH